jgi:hypothetical protein
MGGSEDARRAQHRAAVGRQDLHIRTKASALIRPAIGASPFTRASNSPSRPPRRVETAGDIGQGQVGPMLHPVEPDRQGHGPGCRRRAPPSCGASVSDRRPPSISMAGGTP